MNRQVDQIRAQMGAIALQSMQQDQRLAKLEATQKQLDEFAEAIAPREPQNFREQIERDARSVGQHPDQVALLYGFNNFSEIDESIPVQYQTYSEA